MSNVVVAELAPLLTIDEVKEHLRIEGNDDNDRLELWIGAAVGAVMRYCNVAIVPIGAEFEFKVAALIWIEDQWRQIGPESGLRSEQVDGAFSRTFTDVATMSGLAKMTIGRLLDPYRIMRV
ncbi:head-tail connector protein [Aureimonas ureilytica]|uniref:head-tail connector protein n=1 Tax=Aureimonas ureilytica TaxID=401562 RepID=UPI000364A4BD|nr:head-tail connector protein [Aureimonas ureilytica]